MNNLTALVKATKVRIEPVSRVRYISRSVLLIASALLLVVLPAWAQNPASEIKRITLEELQQMALQNNPTFAQSGANIQAAEGREKQSGLYPNPTVGYQGEEIRGGSFWGGGQGVFLHEDIFVGG